MDDKIYAFLFCHQFKLVWNTNLIRLIQICINIIIPFKSFCCPTNIILIKIYSHSQHKIFKSNCRYFFIKGSFQISFFYFDSINAFTKIRNKIILLTLCFDSHCINLNFNEFSIRFQIIKGNFKIHFKKNSCNFFSKRLNFCNVFEFFSLTKSN